MGTAKVKMDSDYTIANHSTHENLLRSTVKSLLLKNDYSDISISCEDGSIVPAHRIILDMHSSYLKSLAANIEQSKKEVMIVFANTPKKIVLYLLTFFYEGEVIVPKEDCEDFFEFASSLQVKGLDGKKFKAKEDRNEQVAPLARSTADQICAQILRHPVDNSNCPPVSRQPTPPYLPHNMLAPNIFAPSVLGNLAMGGNFFPLNTAMNTPLKPPMMRSPKPASTPRRDNFPNPHLNEVRSPEEILLGNASLDFSKTANDARISPISSSLHNLVSAASNLPNFASQIQQMAQQQQSFNRSQSRSPVGSLATSKVEEEDEPVDVQGVEDESEDHDYSLHSRCDSVNNSNNRSDQTSSSGRETDSPKIDVDEPQKMELASNLCLTNNFHQWSQFAHPPNDAAQNLENPELNADFIQRIISKTHNQPPFQGLYNGLAPPMALPVFNPITPGLNVSPAELENFNKTVANFLNQNSPPSPEEKKSKKTTKRAGPKPKRKSVGGKLIPCTNTEKNPNCGRVYTSIGNLKRHLEFECGKPPRFLCQLETCGLKFQHKHSLKIHTLHAHRKSLDKKCNMIHVFDDPSLTKNGKKTSKAVVGILRDEVEKLKSENSDMLFNDGMTENIKRVVEFLRNFDSIEEDAEKEDVIDMEQ